MDGFVSGVSQRQTARPSRAVMGYYDDRDLPFYWNVADKYVLFDRFFASSRGRQRAQPHVLGDAGSGDPTEASATADDLRPARAARDLVEVLRPGLRPAPAASRRSAARNEHAGGAGAAPQHRRGSSTARSCSGTSSTWTSTTRTCATGRCPQVAYIAPAGRQRAPAAAARDRADAGPVAHHRAGAQHAWPQLGVHVDLRRLGRLVRPRAAAGGAAASACRRCW